jgi:hypothetical protein
MNLIHYNEAKDCLHWIDAMDLQLGALHKAHTYEIVNLLLGRRWVFKVNTKSDATLKRYKVRLIAKCYSQEYEINYEDTFTLVVRMTSVRTLY